MRPHDALIAQLDRALGYELRGREFESLYPDHLILGSLAQSVEQLAFNQLVVGSNPTRPTIFRGASCTGLGRGVAPFTCPAAVWAEH